MKFRLDDYIPRLLFILAISYPLLAVSSYVHGFWLYDTDGNEIATDFIAYWAAGKLALHGEAAQAYDWAAHRLSQLQGLTKDYQGDLPWYYPPPFLLVVAPFALLAYPAAMVTWVVATLAIYAAALRNISRSSIAILGGLAWPATLSNIIIGQNGLLSAALLGFGLAQLDRRPVLAGVMFGLLTYKPQLGLLIPIALIAAGYWRTVFSAAATALLLAATSMLVFGSQTWAAFFTSISRTNDIMLQKGASNFWELQSVFAYLRALGIDAPVAWTAHMLVVAAFAVVTALGWRHRIDFNVRAAMLAVMTMMCSPYSYVYDMAIVGVALVFLLRAGSTRMEQAVILLAGVMMAVTPVEQAPTGLIAAFLILGICARRVFAARANSVADNSRVAA
ncbi:MAG: glycosyltransferase family 87 protein [Mesorhizobium sp.]